MSSFRLLGSEVSLLHVEPGGAYSLLEWRTPPGSPSPPLHLHRRTDEGLHVVRGTLGVVIDDRRTVHGPGSFILLRRGQRHSFWNAGDEVAVFVCLVSPAGLERYFVELAEGLPGAVSADEARELRDQLSSRHDVEVT
jgi:mannose-6-phosphate isomerase-like protein (cupin superfamily)